jgi:hypothetical protein
LVALRAGVFETLVAGASCAESSNLEFSIPARIASNYCSVSTVRFLFGFLVTRDPVVFKLLTGLYILCFVEVTGLETGTEHLCDIFQPIDNT